MTQMRKHLDELNARRRLRIPSIYHNNVKEQFRTQERDAPKQGGRLIRQPFSRRQPSKKQIFQKASKPEKRTAAPPPGLEERTGSTVLLFDDE